MSESRCSFDALSSPEHPSLKDVDRRLVTAFRELLKAFRYAKSGPYEIWDFAVESRTLRLAGLTESDFRWLVCVGYVSHAREVTAFGEDLRQFQQTGKLLFSKRSCFVLTESGAEFVRALLDNHNQVTTNREVLPANLDHAPLVPVWDSQRRELLIGKTLVKQFKWPAVNQETILAVFQELDWPPHIDDPLSPQPEQDPKRRLHDTIKCLNRNQKQKLIRFYGDGTGEGILWKLAK